MSPRVFFFETPPRSLDVTHALTFGSPITVWPRRRCSMWDSSFVPLTLKEMKDHDYDPRTDCVVVVGKMALVAMMVANLIAEHGEINLLLFDPRLGEYRAERVSSRL